jgi:hypothetical protein
LLLVFAKLYGERENRRGRRGEEERGRERKGEEREREGGGREELFLLNFPSSSSL